MAERQTAELARPAPGVARRGAAVMLWLDLSVGLAVAGKLIRSALQRWRTARGRYAVPFRAGAVAGSGRPTVRTGLEGAA